MIRKEVQAIAVIFAVMAMGLVYIGNQTMIARDDLGKLEDKTNTIVETLQEMQETLQTRVMRLEELIIECEVTIDNGTGATTNAVYLTKGATALEALRRVAVVKTTYYTGLGEFIDSIDGISNDPETGMYWMWYIWDGDKMVWELAPVGAGNYKMKDGDSIKFSYEIPAW